MSEVRRQRRRRFLRGAGGAALALPFLEIFHDRRAHAAGEKPMRYVVAFAGSSIGTDGVQKVVPAAPGPLPTDPAGLPRGLVPLGDAGVADVTTIVSGLTIPWGNPIPSGGRYLAFHSSSVCPLTCGLRNGADRDEWIQGPTSDWIVADAIAGDTPHRVLTYRAQAAYYRSGEGTDGHRGLMSARMNGGQLEYVPPTVSPKVAFQTITTGFVPPDPTEAQAAEKLIARRKSIVDLVRGDTERLLAKVGKADKVRLERHLDELRALETRLQTVTSGGSSCVMPADPGEDPPIGTIIDDGGFESQTTGWSNEELRASVLVDLVSFAFACDLSRVANLMLSYAQCFMNMNPLFGYPSDLHEMSHGSLGHGEVAANAMADGVAWHVKHWANLMKKLRDTEDVDGTPVLDSTAMVLAFEGGMGWDPEGQLPDSPHSTENMVALIGGRAGGLHLSPGRHVVKTGEHPVKVVNTAMKAVGVTTHLGEVQGTFDDLFG